MNFSGISCVLRADLGADATCCNESPSSVRLELCVENLQETSAERKPPFYAENLEALRNPQRYNRELFIKLKVASVSQAWSARPVPSAQTHPRLGRGRWDNSVGLNNSGLETRRKALVMLRVFVIV